MELSENWALPTIVGIVVGSIIGKNWKKVRATAEEMIGAVTPGKKK